MSACPAGHACPDSRPSWHAALQRLGVNPAAVPHIEPAGCPNRVACQQAADPLGDAHWAGECATCRQPVLNRHGTLLHDPAYTIRRPHPPRLTQADVA